MFCLIRVAELYEYAMLPEHMNSPDPTVGPNSITETGALCISSGSKTGRVPKQKRLVMDDITRDVSNQPPLNRSDRLDSTHSDYLMNLDNNFATTFTLNADFSFASSPLLYSDMIAGLKQVKMAF